MPEIRRMFAGWLASWREVLIKPSGNDVLAGLTTAAVALPLNVALAIACELPPVTGLIAGAIGGAVAAIFGGARYQVTGPAAALSFMVLELSSRFGPSGVAAAAIFAGLVTLALSFARAGKLMARVPESVLAGFISGVGLRLLDGQLPELLGFNYRVVDLAQMLNRPTWVHEVSWVALGCGVFVAVLVLSTTKFQRFPAAIVGIGLVTLVSVLLNLDIERVGTLPSSFLPPQWPHVEGEVDWLELLAASLPVSVLVGIEALLSARALDRRSKAKEPHDANLELLGQGLANIVAGLFQGMPVTGVVVRSTVNFQSGARTRLASLIHAVVLGLSVLLLSRYLAHVPLATLAGLLCVIGVRLLEVKTFRELFRTSRLEAVAFMMTLICTAMGSLMTGLLAGMTIHLLNGYLTADSPEKPAPPLPVEATVDDDSGRT
jgi:SulP family sulfate permease